jgi:hypothetical protein
MYGPCSVCTHTLASPTAGFLDRRTLLERSGGPGRLYRSAGEQTSSATRPTQPNPCASLILASPAEPGHQLVANLAFSDDLPGAQNYYQKGKVGRLTCMSIGSLVEEETPMVWRGPMVMGALEQTQSGAAPSVPERPAPRRGCALRP